MSNSEETAYAIIVAIIATIAFSVYLSLYYNNKPIKPNIINYSPINETFNNIEFMK